MWTEEKKQWTKAEKELWKKFCDFYKVVDSTQPLKLSLEKCESEKGALETLTESHEIIVDSYDSNFSVDRSVQVTKFLLKQLFIHVLNAYLSETDIKEAWHYLYEGLRVIRPGNFFSQLALPCSKVDKANDFFFYELPKIIYQKSEDLAKQYLMDLIAEAFTRKFEKWEHDGTLTQLKQIEKFLKFITRSSHMIDIPPSEHKNNKEFIKYEKLVETKMFRRVGFFEEANSVEFERFATKKLKKEVKKYFKEVKHLLKDGLFPRKR